MFMKTDRDRQRLACRWPLAGLLPLSLVLAGCSCCVCRFCGVHAFRLSPLQFAAVAAVCSVQLQFAVCSVQCAVCSVQCAVCSVQCAVCSVQCAVCSVQCAVCSVCAMCSVQCAVCSVQCAVCSVQCAVCCVQLCSVQCAVCSVQCAVGGVQFSGPCASSQPFVWRLPFTVGRVPFAVCRVPFAVCRSLLAPSRFRRRRKRCEAQDRSVWVSSYWALYCVPS